MAHYHCFDSGRDRLARGWSSARGCLCEEIWLSLSGSLWCFPGSSIHDKLVSYLLKSLRDEILLTMCRVTCNTPSMLTIPFAIALHNSCAGLGQIVAQWIWRAQEKERGYPTGNFTCAACSFFVAAVMTSLRLWYGHMNRKGMKDARGEKRIWSY